MNEEIERTQAWHEMQQAIWLIRTTLSDRIEEEAGMTLSEHDALWQLANNVDRRMTMSALAERAMVTRSGATRLVDRLTKKGWVQREPSAESRRVTYVALTTEGVKAVRQSTQALARHQGEMFDERLTDTDVADLRRVLGKLLRRLDLA